MKIIDADELEPDTEWSDYYDGFVSYSKSQIDAAEEVKAIQLDEVKQAREKTVEKVCMFSGSGDEITQAYCDGLKAGLEILDKLMEGVEDGSKESKQTNIAC